MPVSGSRIRKRKVSSVAPPSAPGSNAPMQQQPAEGVDVLEDDMGEGDGSAQPAQATRTKDPSTQVCGHSCKVYTYTGEGRGAPCGARACTKRVWYVCDVLTISCQTGMQQRSKDSPHGIAAHKSFQQG